MELALNKEIKLQQDKKTLAITTQHQSNVTYQLKKLSSLAMIIFTGTTSADTNNVPVIHLVTEHLPPYQIENKNKKSSGFAVDIIKETMARSNYTYSLKSYPWVRSYKLAQIKANHCIFSIARLKSREALFKWVGPISKVNNTAMWGLKDQKIVVNNLEDAKKYTIAVNRNDIAHTGLVERGFIEGKHLYVLDDAKSLINILITRPEIDLIVADDTTVNFRAELAGVSVDKLQKIHEIKGLPLDFFFACSRQTDDKIIKHLATKLHSLYKDGTYEAIWNQWKSKMISIE
tara:strand:+ start:301 stop:1167 length:867 start_codon:yes stop_codon:yes gene_type:complete